VITHSVFAFPPDIERGDPRGLQPVSLHRPTLSRWLASQW
jgi:hypothetical protein